MKQILFAISMIVALAIIPSTSVAEESIVPPVEIPADVAKVVAFEKSKKALSNRLRVREAELIIANVKASLPKN